MYHPVDDDTTAALNIAAEQCIHALEAAGAPPNGANHPRATVVNLDTLIAGYPEGQVPNENSVFQFVALLGEMVRVAYGGYWAEAEMRTGRELGVVTEGPHGDIFWNLTGKMRRRLPSKGEQETLVFYWDTIGSQLKQR